MQHKVRPSMLTRLIRIVNNVSYLIGRFLNLLVEETTFNSFLWNFIAGYSDMSTSKRR